MSGTALIIASIFAAIPIGTIPQGKPPEIDGIIDVASIPIDLARINLETRRSPMPKNLKITVWQNMPYSGVKKGENGELVGEGYAFDLLEILQSKLNFTYDIVAPDPEHLGIHENRSYTAAIKLLETKKVDMAVSFIPLVPELTEVLTFSSIIDDIGITFMMKRPSESAIGSGLTAPFTQTVWICILIALIIFGPLIFVIIYYRGKVEESRGREGYSLVTCIWFAYGSLLKQGSVVEPVTDSTRVLFATWWVFITILTSFYTANLTAFLTLSEFTLPFNSVQDIIEARQIWFAYRDQIVDESLKFIKPDDPKDLRHLRNSYKEHLGVYIPREKSDSNVYRNLQREKLFLCEVQMADKILYEDYRYRTLKAVKESARCVYVQKPGILFSKYRAFAFQKDSVIADHMNMHLLNLIESGFLKHLSAEDVPSVKYCPLDLKSTERKLRNADFGLTYKIIGSGFAVGIAFFFGELFYTFGKKRKERRNFAFCCGNKMIDDEEAIDYKNDPRPEFLKQNLSAYNKNGEKMKKVVMNGRDYWVIKEGSGEQRLVPMRTPSALLFDYRS